MQILCLVWTVGCLDCLDPNFEFVNRRVINTLMTTDCFLFSGFASREAYLKLFSSVIQRFSFKP